LFVNPQTPWAKAKLKRGPLRAVRTSEFTLASAQPALRLDVSAFPLPQWRQAEDADMDMAESAGENQRCRISRRLPKSNTSTRGGIGTRWRGRHGSLAAASPRVGSATANTAPQCGQRATNNCSETSSGCNDAPQFLQQSSISFMAVT
jgi:hypothetical protein